MKLPISKRWDAVVALLVAVLLVNSCQLPHDPEKSWKKAQQNGLRIGIVDNPPFAQYHSGQPSGREVSLVTKFAHEHGMELKFFPGSESELIKMLEKYDLDVLIGGFEKKTLWIQKASPGATYDEKHVLLIPKGENRLLYELDKFIFEYRSEQNNENS